MPNCYCRQLLSYLFINGLSIDRTEKTIESVFIFYVLAKIKIVLVKLVIVRIRP